MAIPIALASKSCTLLHLLQLSCRCRICISFDRSPAMTAAGEANRLTDQLRCAPGVGGLTVTFSLPEARWCESLATRTTMSSSVFTTHCAARARHKVRRGRQGREVRAGRMGG